MRRARLFQRRLSTWDQAKALGVLYFLSVMLSASGGPAGLFLMLALAGTVVIGVRWMGRQAEINALTAQLNQHLRVLATKHATLESRNGYGTVHPREWGKEVDRFLASTGVVLKRLSPADAHKLITRAVEQDRRTGLAARLQSAWEGGALRDPLQFEAACAAKLERLGWTTSLTAKSGDQGVDILARKGETLAVVQCKLYSQPVDNSAVQQVFAGKAFAGAALAAVVSNAGFTRSAHELASRCEVLLLHYTDLDKLDAATRLIPDFTIAASNNPIERGLLGNRSGRSRRSA